jgi:hypothetical protein
MADFRKWLFAFAVVALVVCVSMPAHAQPISPNAIQCVANAGVPPIVRAEGITELVGDVVLNCTGGTPATAGVPIPTLNITVFLNTNITSRLNPVGGGGFGNGSEAMILIDEPFPAAAQNPASAVRPANTANQGYCFVASNGTLNATCPLVGTGGGVGATGPYANINVFQGQQVGANSVAWLGIPIDAPGTTQTRTIRITNVRANACQLGVSSTLVPTQIFEFIAVNGSQNLAINNPQQVVAFIQPGLISSVSGAGTFLQCNNLNGNFISSSTPIGVAAGPINLRADEGFASSFKGRAYATPTGTTIGQSTPSLQNVPGFAYFTESGFVSAVTGGAVAGAVGVADYGTRVMFAVNSVGAGVNLFAPSQVNLFIAGTTTASGGIALLVTGTDANGNGGTLFAGTPSTTDRQPITINGTSGFVVYEVIHANPNALERMTVGLSVAFVSNTASNLPATGQSTVSISFAPLSTVNTASSSAPIPRYCNTSVARNVFLINLCQCNLLFPFVTNQAGFDTGIALANTSLDTFGTTPQSGTVKISYFGNTTGGGAAPAAQTSQTVVAGNELVFTLSGGGNLGIAATPGFQGYIIATSNFQFCHAFAFISDLGSTRLAEGYLAIQLDEPFSLIPGATRTGQLGESQAH